MTKRVVITGLGTINPLGNNIGEYFSNLNDGVSGASLIDRFDTTLFKTRFACQIKNYNPADFGIDRKESRKLDKFTEYALIATDEAIKDSGMDLDVIDKSRVGVVLGSGIGGIETLCDELRDFFVGDGTPRFSPFNIVKIITNIAPGWISLKYGFAGPGYSVSSSILLAISLATKTISSSDTDSGLTATRISRPAWMAKDLETPGCSLAIFSRVSRRLM
jgi:3-oxoacyl-[acyl-carrier-protein] synthase II